MISATNVAITGLKADETRLAVSANNIANQDSTKSNVNGKIVNKVAPPQQVDQITLSDGAVRALTRDVNPPTVTVPDNNPQGSGTTQAPNVNQEQEAVNIEQAAAAFKANLAVIKAQNKTQQSLLNIKT